MRQSERLELLEPQHDWNECEGIAEVERGGFREMY